jgi:hypothetical protein
MGARNGCMNQGKLTEGSLSGVSPITWSIRILIGQGMTSSGNRLTTISRTLTPNSFLKGPT